MAEHPIRRVAIVDDSERDASLLQEVLSDLGLEAQPLSPPYESLETLLAEIIGNFDAAVCDHRLRGMATFTGARAVAALTTAHLPAVLVTQYIDIDSDVSIREWRKDIPVLLSRDEADGQAVVDGIKASAEELAGKYAPGRFPRRTIMQIDAVDEESGERVIDVRIPAWNPQRVVRLPVRALPALLRDTVAAGRLYLAEVNTGATSAQDLYFTAFELAPDPGADDLA